MFKKKTGNASEKKAKREKKVKKEKKEKKEKKQGLFKLRRRKKAGEEAEEIMDDVPMEPEDELEEEAAKSHAVRDAVKGYLDSLGMMKWPLIIALALFAVLLVFAAVIHIRDMYLQLTTGSYPITAITAENDRTYAQGETYENSDFTVRAEHENGRYTTLSPDEFTVSQDQPNRTGSITPVTITLNANAYITTECKLSNVREFVMSFECGTPDITSVKAVLYSNGELAFEGEGDVAKFDGFNFPWLDYDGDDDYPITSVSFEETVTPSSMDDWFVGLDTLTYIQAIPSSVRSMRYTFDGCTSLTTAADWSACKALYDITGCYEDCYSLTEALPLTSCIREADEAYAGCVSLETAPDLTKAVSLTSGSEMFSGCSSLSACGPLSANINDISSMFKDCINLKEAPALSKKLLNMNSTFSGCLSLEKASEIPSAVTDISRCYYNCRMLSGEVPVNCNAESYSGFLQGTGLATYINLTGTSMYLNVYANDSDSSRVSVYGSSPDPDLSTVRDVQQAQQLAAEAAETEEMQETEISDTSQTQETVSGQEDASTSSDDITDTDSEDSDDSVADAEVVQDGEVDEIEILEEYNVSDDASDENTVD